MRHYITTIMALLLLVACQGKEAAVMEDSKEIFIPLTKRENFTVEDLFSEYHYVQLETNEQCLLDDCDGLRRILVDDEGKIYIGALHKVFVFHPDGRLDWVLDRRGDGPESYNHLWVFQVWKNGDITVLQPHGNQLTTYSKTGKFISKYRYDELELVDLACLGDSLMLLRESRGVRDKYRFYVTDRYTGELKGHYWHLQEKQRLTYWMRSFLYSYEGKLLYHDYQMNEIYEMYRDTAIMRYRINVDNRIPPEGYWTQPQLTSRQLYDDYGRSGYIGHIPYYVESDSLIFLRFEGGQKELRAYATIDKKTRETRLMKRLIFDDRFNWEPEVVFSLRDGWCVIPLYPDKVLANPLFSARFPGLNEESNPVLFIGKLK